MICLHANKSQLKVKRGEPLTSGSVNVYGIRFAFSGDWEGLTKTAVFRTSSRLVSAPLDESGECVIPWEVLRTPGVWLEAGVYGTLAMKSYCRQCGQAWV